MAGSSAGWIDIHAHLDALSPHELHQAINDATLANVTTILSTATELSSAGAVLEQCRTFPALYGALGISPFDARALPAGWEGILRNLLTHPRCIAVGEIGIDGSNPRYPPLEEQLPFFEKQLTIAKELDLPAVIHSRGVEKNAAEICRSLGVRKALFHCFTGSVEALEAILEAGYCVSFSGIITFSEAVRNLVNIVPLDRLFVETDTPYLAPTPHRGKTNCPAWVALVGEEAAKCKGVTARELREAIAKNFERLFLEKVERKG
jgi:TatD DNase family protein